MIHLRAEGVKGFSVKNPLRVAQQLVLVCSLFACEVQDAMNEGLAFKHLTLGRAEAVELCPPLVSVGDWNGKACVLDEKVTLSDGFCSKLATHLSIWLQNRAELLARTVGGLPRGGRTIDEIFQLMERRLELVIERAAPDLVWSQQEILDTRIRAFTEMINGSVVSLSEANKAALFSLGDVRRLQAWFDLYSASRTYYSKTISLDDLPSMQIRYTETDIPFVGTKLKFFGRSKLLNISTSGVNASGCVGRVLVDGIRDVHVFGQFYKEVLEQYNDLCPVGKK